MLRGLNVSSSVGLAIITRLDCRGQSHTLENLRIVSTELLGVYRDVSGKPEGGNFTGVTEEPNNDDFEPNQILVSAKRNLSKNREWKRTRLGKH